MLYNKKVMKLKKLRKIHQGKFLSYYEGDFENENGTKKTYEIVSRDGHLNEENFGKNVPAGVALVSLSEDHQRILLQSEFRYATNKFIYNFPAGLVDPGESVEQAARRELREETGLEVVDVIDVLPPSYASPGTSDELMQIIICTVKGEIKPSCYELEEIQAKWFTKEEVKQLLKNKEPMSARTQMFLWSWVNKEIL